MSTFQRVPVHLKPRSYDVLIGSHHLDRLGPWIRRLRLGSHAVVVTNPKVLRIHARSVVRVLTNSGLPVEILTVADTERSKSMSTLRQLLCQLADLDKPGRQIFLVLVGGGVVGDLGGLGAGIYKRGIPYVHVPTTLLAQVDSSIGGKTGVDLPHGKNLVGLFYQPWLVFVELKFLHTLSNRQFCSGLAEVAKCGIIRDRELFRVLERTSVSDLRSSEQLLGWVIARAIGVKASIVGADERETKGIRTILNFGHTVGHALEAASRYSRAVTHGEAVAIGMIVATRIARHLEMIPASDATRMERLIHHLGLPTAIRGIALANVLKAMTHDKKWTVGKNRWILPTGVGQVLVHRKVPERTVRACLRGLLEG